MTNVFEADKLNDLAAEIDAAVDDLIVRRSEGMVAGEVPFTEQLLSTIRGVVDGYSLDLKPTWSPSPFGFLIHPDTIELEAFQINARRKGPIHMDGRSLTNSGPGAEERHIGADILLVLETKGIEGLAPMKGLLAQSKRHDGDFAYTAAQDLFRQCRDMHRVTDSSFAFIYAKNGLFVFDNPVAAGVQTLREGDVQRTIGEVIAGFVDCELGDQAITEKQIGKFAQVARELKKKRFPAAARAMNADALVVKVGN